MTPIPRRCRPDQKNHTHFIIYHPFSPADLQRHMKHRLLCVCVGGGVLVHKLKMSSACVCLFFSPSLISVVMYKFEIFRSRLSAAFYVGCVFSYSSSATMRLCAHMLCDRLPLIREKFGFAPALKGEGGGGCLTPPLPFVFSPPPLLLSGKGGENLRQLLNQ